MVNSRKDIVKVLKQELALECLFAFLFGSAGADKLSSESDIDVGVFLKVHPVKSYEIEEKISSGLSKIFSRDVDVIVLNVSDPIVTMQVIDGGFLVFSHDDVLLNEFKARKISEYIDFKKSREVIESKLLSAGWPKWQQNQKKT